MTEEKSTYTLSDIYELLGGDDYYPEETIQYIYNSLNENFEKAEYYKKICLEQSEKLQNEYKKLKSEAEIKRIEENNKSIE